MKQLIFFILSAGIQFALANSNTKPLELNASCAHEPYLVDSVQVTLASGITQLNCAIKVRKLRGIEPTANRVLFVGNSLRLPPRFKSADDRTVCPTLEINAADEVYYSGEFRATTKFNRVMRGECSSVISEPFFHLLDPLYNGFIISVKDMNSENRDCKFMQFTVTPAYQISVNKACFPNYFKCTSEPADLCVPGSVRCDGFKNCYDGSDEMNCEQLEVVQETKRIPEFAFYVVIAVAVPFLLGTVLLLTITCSPRMQHWYLQHFPRRQPHPDPEDIRIENIGGSSQDINEMRMTMRNMQERLDLLETQGGGGRQALEAQEDGGDGGRDSLLQSTSLGPLPSQQSEQDEDAPRHKDLHPTTVPPSYEETATTARARHVVIDDRVTYVPEVEPLLDPIPDDSIQFQNHYEYEPEEPNIPAAITDGSQLLTMDTRIVMVGAAPQGDILLEEMSTGPSATPESESLLGGETALVQSADEMASKATAEKMQQEVGVRRDRRPAVARFSESGKWVWELSRRRERTSWRQLIRYPTKDVILLSQPVLLSESVGGWKFAWRLHLAGPELQVAGWLLNDEYNRNLIPSGGKFAGLSLEVTVRFMRPDTDAESETPMVSGNQLGKTISRSVIWTEPNETKIIGGVPLSDLGSYATESSCPHVAIQCDDASSKTGRNRQATGASVNGHGPANGEPNDSCKLS